MKLSYFPDTDSLYIDLSDEPSKLVLSRLPSAVETAAAWVALTATGAGYMVADVVGNARQ